MIEHPRFLNAGNTGLFTFDGTRTYLVGTSSVAVIDPGPDVDSHVRALVDVLQDAQEVRILLTHDHGDHAGAAEALAAALGAQVLGPPMPGVVDRPLRHGEEVTTDDGTLVAVHSPGHAREHFSFLWRERKALFAGDLLLGYGDTTWVADYPGCVADYLASLADLRAYELDVIYPAHGPPLDDPIEALDRFERHRRSRIAQVETILAQDPSIDMGALLNAVYGREVPAGLRAAAEKSLLAVIEHVRGGRPA